MRHRASWVQVTTSMTAQTVEASGFVLIAEKQQREQFASDPASSRRA
jgi:hypothetical protein